MHGRIKLREKLVRELAQAEHDALVRAAREARRYPGTEPARRLRAIADHASVSSRSLDVMAGASQPIGSRAAHAVAELLSGIREAIADRGIDRERAYRAALLGVRHGLGIALLLREVAARENDHALADFCRRLVDERTPLVERAEASLAWFAQYPELALEHGGASDGAQLQCPTLPS
jgi:hypothetical protein